MSVRLGRLMGQQLGVLRYEPTAKRIRALSADRVVIDSRRAMLVWEPKRVVPSYAVPAEDIAAELVPGSAGPTPAAPTDAPQLGDRPVYDPSVPFAVHTADGEPASIRADGREAAAFRLADPDLDGYVVVDFAAFDAWYEEDERNVAHPRDPFHRIEILHSSRHVELRCGGTTVAESTRPYLLFEPPLPVRYYLPPEDVRTDLLQPSDKRTYCAYKGEASYFSLGDEQDVAWQYLRPLREAAEITGRIAFFNEQVDLVVDGEPVHRPVTPWSRPSVSR